MMENGWDKEKDNGELAMPILVTGGEGGGLNQNLQQIFQYFIYTTSLSTVVPDVYIFQVVSKPTLLVQNTILRFIALWLINKNI